MTDRQLERNYVNAKKFAKSIDGNRLKEGAGTLRQLDYYSRRMREYGLNPESREHCELAKLSLEERLKAAGSELILSHSEGLSVMGQDNFKDFYFSECERVKKELVKLYALMKKRNTVEFSREIFRKDKERYYLRLKYTNSLEILQFDKEKKWDTEECIHGLFSIEMTRTSWRVIIEGNNCKHMPYDPSGHKFNDIIKNAYSFYFENPMIEAETFSRFEYYFGLFRKIPEALREALDGNGLIGLKNDVAKKIMGTI